MQKVMNAADQYDRPSEDIPNDTFEETHLGAHLFLHYSKLNLEEKSTLINVAGTPAFVKILKAHHKEATDALVNIVTLDKDKLFEEYSLTRNRALLIHDILGFLVKVKADLVNLFPDAFAPDQPIQE